jgi:hypothetical protein
LAKRKLTRSQRLAYLASTTPAIHGSGSHFHKHCSVESLHHAPTLKKANFELGVVNPDCTGRFSVDTAPGFPPIVVYFVVVKHGAEIRGVTNGSAITYSAFKVN